MDNVTMAPLMEALQSAITPAQIVGMLASVIGAGIVFVLMWFGIRKLIKVFRDAVTRGQISS